MYGKRLTFFSLLLMTLIPVQSFSNSPNNFSQAKKIADTLFAGRRITLYCGCAYDGQKHVDLASCEMLSAENKKLAHKIEWEHMMPAENFGRQLTCWHTAICVNRNGKPYKGRRCCKRSNADYRHTEAELYNLWPAVALINRVRSNYRYAILPTGSSSNDYYGCRFKINRPLRCVEPQDSAKGTVARANLFMADHYHIKLSASQRQLFENWNKKYPPAAEEKQWAKRVAKVEGYNNPYISLYFLKP